MVTKVRQLETLSPEAKTFFTQTRVDQQSLAGKLGIELLGFAATREGVGEEGLSLEALKKYVDDDKDALQEIHHCLFCLGKAVVNELEEHYYEDPKVQAWVKHYDAVMHQFSEDNRNPMKIAEFLEYLEEFENKVKLWHPDELQRVRKLGARILEKLLAAGHSDSRIIPVRWAMIDSRRGDEQGEIKKSLKGNDKFYGDFIMVEVDAQTCWHPLAFLLGLEPGCYVFAGCMSATNFYHHLYQLRNIRLLHKKGSRRNWQLLDYRPYYDALQEKRAKEEHNSKKISILDVWEDSKNKARKKPRKGFDTKIVVGEKLEKLLAARDSRARTIRGLILRYNPITLESELLMCLEAGDNPGKKTGKKSSQRQDHYWKDEWTAGKPPGTGCPGGNKEKGKGENILDCINREFSNETGCGEVTVLAYLGSKRKTQLYVDQKDPYHFDDWFWARAQYERDLYLPGRIVERGEIAESFWLPLSRLAECLFQNTKRPETDLGAIKDKLIVYCGQAQVLAEAMVHLSAMKMPADPKDPNSPLVPVVKLPSNWHVFQEKVEDPKQFTVNYR